MKKTNSLEDLIEVILDQLISDHEIPIKKSKKINFLETIKKQQAYEAYKNFQSSSPTNSTK